MTEADRNRRNPTYVVTRLGLNLALIAVVILAALAILRLDRLWPIRPPAALVGPGRLLILIGLLLIAAAEYSLLTAGGATGAPGDPTRRTVVRGPYRWTRNPVYLGGMLLLFGLALARRSPTILVVAVAFALAMHLAVVLVEEPRTERRLGEAYRSYRQSVPRWLPRWPRRRPRAAPR